MGEDVGKILVVDDSITILELVAEVLEPQGFQTLQALDGHDALPKLLHNPDILAVMCDVNMPRMNGIELLARAREKGVNVPFIMLTTETQPELIERARALGVKAWMSKPFKPQTLVATVRAIVQQSLRPAAPKAIDV